MTVASTPEGIPTPLPNCASADPCSNSYRGDAVWSEPEVRKTLSFFGPEAGPTPAFFRLYSHRNARASLHLLGQPDTILAGGRGRARFPAGGGARARSHCRFVLPPIHFIPDSLTYSVSLSLKRPRDRTPGGAWPGSGWAARPALLRPDVQPTLRLGRPSPGR
jgi:hypothetical protein